VGHPAARFVTAFLSDGGQRPQPPPPYRVLTDPFHVLERGASPGLFTEPPTRELLREPQSSDIAYG
jgi:hypothetical protein